nr:MAG TPA: hypothetical protein [Bacteriophage sp.]
MIKIYKSRNCLLVSLNGVFGIIGSLLILSRNTFGYIVYNKYLLLKKY